MFPNSFNSPYRPPTVDLTDDSQDPPPPTKPVSTQKRRSATLEELPAIVADVVDYERQRQPSQIFEEFAPPEVASPDVRRARAVIAMVQHYRAGISQNEMAFGRFANHVQAEPDTLRKVMLPNGDFAEIGLALFMQHASDEQRNALANQTNPGTSLPRDMDGLELQSFDPPLALEAVDLPALLGN
jgi:hypothetical protein